MAHAKNIGEPFMAHAKNLYNIPCYSNSYSRLSDKRRHLKEKENGGKKSCEIF